MDDTSHPDAIVDPFPVSELENRYRSQDGTPIKKSALNNRMNSLGIKSFSIPGYGSKRFIHAADVVMLDELDVHIQQGGTIATFLNQRRTSTQESPDLNKYSTKIVLGKKTDQPSKPAQTPTKLNGDPTLWDVFCSMSVQEAIAHLTKPLQKLLYPSHRKTEDAMRTLVFAEREEITLPTSRLTDLLDLRPSAFHGKKSVSCMGFRFIRVGKEGRESAWRIIKPKPDSLEEQT